MFMVKEKNDGASRARAVSRRAGPTHGGRRPAA